MVQASRRFYDTNSLLINRHRILEKTRAWQISPSSKKKSHSLY